MGPARGTSSPTWTARSSSSVIGACWATAFCIAAMLLGCSAASSVLWAVSGWSVSAMGRSSSSYSVLLQTSTFPLGPLAYHHRQHLAGGSTQAHHQLEGGASVRYAQPWPVQWNIEDDAG